MKPYIHLRVLASGEVVPYAAVFLLRLLASGYVVPYAAVIPSTSIGK
jgi:hypothetical protein